jgi:predicted DNA-binding transcriptional regulator AlpA
MQRLNAQTVQPEYVGQRDAAVFIGRSVSFVQKLDRNGAFVPKYRINRASSYRLSDIREWMERHLERQ